MNKRQTTNNVFFFFGNFICFYFSYEVAANVLTRAENLPRSSERDYHTIEYDPQIKWKTSQIWNETGEHLDNLLSKYNDTCDILKYEIPDFRAEGRRISEVKCLEHIWTIRYKVVLSKRKIRCRGGKVPVVLGGDDANVGEFPHVCAIGWRAAASPIWLFKCGGVLISSKYVLTAAHCSKVSRRDHSVADPSPKIVGFGAVNLSSTDIFDIPKYVSITRIIVHEKYNSPKIYYDIALIELKAHLEFTKKIHPSCIWTSNDDLSGKATLAGWGVVDTATGKTSEILQVAAVDMLPSQECNDSLKTIRNRNWQNGLDSHQICAGHLKGGIDACQGDSGGPLQIKIDMPLHLHLDWRMYYLVGITSFGHGCGKPNTPSIFSRVSYFADWIESIVWSTETNSSMIK